MLKLRINPLALEDLIGIKKYISEELDNHDAALRIVGKIRDRYSKLREFPFLGVSLDSRIDISTDFRYLVCENYYVFYKIDDNYISIYRVLNARMDFMGLLFSDD